MFKSGLSAAVAMLAAALPTSAFAAVWTLSADNTNIMGQFELDFTAGLSSSIQIIGEIESYDSPLYTFINTYDIVADEIVFDYLKFRSSAQGTRVDEDLGGGEAIGYVVNEASIEIGTLDNPLDPNGGEYDVIINEVFVFDGYTRYCTRFEQIYSDTGEYLGEGDCLVYETEWSYNIGEEYFYVGKLSAGISPAKVPLGASANLLLSALALTLLRRRLWADRT